MGEIKVGDKFIDNFFSDIACVDKKDDKPRPKCTKSTDGWANLCTMTADLKSVPDCKYLDKSVFSKASLYSASEGYKTHEFYVCKANESLRDLIKSLKPNLNYGKVA